MKVSMFSICLPLWIENSMSLDGILQTRMRYGLKQSSSDILIPSKNFISKHFLWAIIIPIGSLHIDEMW